DAPPTLGVPEGECDRSAGAPATTGACPAAPAACPVVAGPRRPGAGVLGHGFGGFVCRGIGVGLLEQVRAVRRLATGPVVAPVAVGGDELRHACVLVDQEPVVAELDVPSARGAQVVGHHLVVGVTAEGGGDREPVLECALHGLGDLVHL